LKFLFIFFLIIPLNLFAEDLSSFEKVCAEVGFKPKTSDYGDCVLELRSRELKKTNKPKIQKANTEQSSQANQIASPKTREVGDGSNNDNICQKYGFNVGDEGYKKCRLDLDVAQRQAEAEMAQFEQQKRQYEEQKRQYEAQLQAEHDKKEMQAGMNLLMYGLGLAGGRTRSEAAPALYGLPMYPRQPAPTIVNIAPSISRPGQNMRCDYDYYTKLMRCNY
jgi:hypothetical protein